MAIVRQVAGWRSWWTRRGASGGRPRSGNGASSFHLFWQLPTEAPLVEVRATLEVVEEPAVGDLYFWALQAGFEDGGGAHLGLQCWGDQGPGRFVNWGGYGPDGQELRGSSSPLPSSLGNVNTRDLDWVPGRAHHLRIARHPDGGWGGWVRPEGSAAELLVRHLDGGGRSLRDPVVWSEVFARCDAPSAAVRWSGLAATTEAGDEITALGVVTSYQSPADGGCADTDSRADGDGGFLQTTGTPRVTPAGAVLPA